MFQTTLLEIDRAASARSQPVGLWVDSLQTQPQPQVYPLPPLPLVSVIIPAYNAETYIADTLQSVLAQTYQHLEIVVVDDGSQDSTPNIVQAFARRDCRIIFLRQQNSGVAAARNLAIQHSRGMFIAPLDADDIWYPQKIEKQVQCMLNSPPSVGLVYTWSIDINEAGTPTGRGSHFTLEGDVFQAMIYCNFLGNASVPLIRRSCLEIVGGYNSELWAQNAQGCEDRDLYLRIAERYQFRVVPEFLMGYRKAIGTMSCNYRAMVKSHLLVLERVRARHPHVPACLYRWSTGNFYMYLAMQSRRSGHHASTLYLLAHAVMTDIVNLLRLQFYTIALKSMLNLIAYPIARLFWPDRQSWLRFRQSVKNWFKGQPLKSTGRSPSFPEIKHKTEPVASTPRHLYEKIRQRRWLQVVQPVQQMRNSIRNRSYEQDQPA